MTLVTVFGGTGFLGRRIVERLTREGKTVRVAVRQADRIGPLTKSAEIGRMVPIAADVRDPSTVAAATAGAESVVNAVATYLEKGGVTYTAVHVQGAGNIATACQEQNVARLVHISGMGVDSASGSSYIRARGLGEIAVRKALPDATILRPSVMFDVGGGFLSILEKVVRSTPLVPLIGGGHTRLAPVHVNDIAEAVCQSLRDDKTRGKTYELGGPETYTLREVFEIILVHTGRARRFVSIPFALADPLARVLELVPGAPLTVAQVDLLRCDNIRATGTLGFEDLGITTQGLLDTIVQMARAN